MKHLLSCIVVALLSVVIPSNSRADTLTFVAASGGVSAGENLYPYTFNLNDSSDRIALMCLDMNLDITPGETWSVQELAVPLDSSAQSIGYRADASLYSQLGQYRASDIPYAAWKVFDPADAPASSAWDNTASYLARLGIEEALDQDLAQAGFYGQFAVYAPTGDVLGWTAGQPQDLLGKNYTSPLYRAVVATPEPATLVLLAFGMLGTGMLLLQYHRSDPDPAA